MSAIPQSFEEGSKEALGNLNPGQFDELTSQMKEVPSPIKEATGEFFRPGCNYFFKTPDYKKGDKTNTAYKVCCEIFDFCSIYGQSWFNPACGGGALLLLILIGALIGSIIFFRKKRKSFKGTSKSPKSSGGKKGGKKKFGFGKGKSGSKTPKAGGNKKKAAPKKTGKK